MNVSIPVSLLSPALITWAGLCLWVPSLASLPVLDPWSCCWGCPATCFTPALPFRRANALEEQLKEQELIACEKVLEEARRQRELLCRVEREKSIEVENLQAR